jgi:hypothetical protein
MRPTVRQSLLLSLLLLAGCGGPPTLDEGAHLDLRTVFSDVTDIPGRAPAGGEHQVMAGSLVGAVHGEGWHLYAEPGEAVTVLTHAAEEGRTDALIWIEEASDLVRRRPREEQIRFLLTVDPPLARPHLQWEEAAVRRGPGEPPRIHEAVRIATTRTGGRGLGYASAPESFSGWRWMGDNGQGVFMRLARTHGTWGEQPSLDPALRPPIDRLAREFPLLEGLRAGLPPAGSTSRPAGGLPAEMVLGSAVAEDATVHLALVCQRSPLCRPAQDLAAFLASLRPGARWDTSSGANLQALPLSELAYDPGLRVIPRNELLDPVAERSRS